MTILKNPFIKIGMLGGLVLILANCGTPDSGPSGKAGYWKVYHSGATTHPTVTTKNADKGRILTVDEAEGSRPEQNSGYWKVYHSGAKKHPTVTTSGADKGRIFTAEEMGEQEPEQTVTTAPSTHTARQRPDMSAGSDATPPSIIVTSPAHSVLTSIQKGERIILKGRVIDASAIAEVNINGFGVVLDRKGEFHVDLGLVKGMNNIFLNAVDIYGNRADKNFIITREGTPGPGAVATRMKDLNRPRTATPTPVTAQAQSAGPVTGGLKNWYSTQYALVVGIDRYQSPDLDILKNAVNDARSIARMFKKMGYRVIELYNQNATRNAIISSFSSLRKQVGRSDSVVFYFAGHGQGVPLENGEKVGYVAPYDANIGPGGNDVMTLDQEAIALNSLKKYSKALKAKHIAMLFDSCFSGLAMKRNIVIKRDGFDLSYYEDLLDRKAIEILTAGDDQPVSDGSGHSPFTQAILYGLDRGGLDIIDRDGLVTFSQLALYVKEKVEKATNRRQRPQFDNLIMDDGDFIFKVK